MKNKCGKILNTLLALIAIVIIIFVIIWITKKNNNTEIYNKTFTNNINEMQEIAKDYFASDLPTEIGETNHLSLNEMYEEGLIEDLFYGNTDCNGTLSYISVTKTSDNEYRVKSNLVCGAKKDTISEKIKATTIIKNEDGTIYTDDETIFNEDDNTTINNGTTNNTTTNNKTTNNTTKSNYDDDDDEYYTIDGKTKIKKETNTTTKKCTTTSCSVERIDTKCTTEYTYEYVKRSAYCPGGYSYQNGQCVRSVIETTPKYGDTSSEETIIEDAKVKVGKNIKKYTDVLIDHEEGTLYCPTGYTLNGTKCYKYTNATEKIAETCPSGYTKEGSTCVNKVNVTETVTESCPSGYTKEGSTCVNKVNVTETVTETCPSGYTKEGSTCVAKVNPTQTVTYSCPSGYSKTSDNKCTKTVAAKESCSTSYSSWGNPTSTYTTTTKESTYSNTTSKKVLTGTTTRNGVTYYTYSIYKRTANKSCSYSCSEGTKSGSSCIITKNADQSVTTSCPSGYTKDNNICKKTTNVTRTVTTSCPSGYTKDNNICKKTTNVIRDVTYTCPSGYNKTSDNKCVSTINASSTSGSTRYYCPNGYTQEGTGVNTKCYVMIKEPDTYYCENPKAKLSGNKCYYNKSTVIPGSCPSGYSYDSKNDNCYRWTNETTKVQYQIVDRIWSKAETIYGYTKTGVATFIMTCTPLGYK